jgi:hypothetical protein
MQTPEGWKWNFNAPPSAAVAAAVKAAAADVAAAAAAAAALRLINANRSLAGRQFCSAQN